MRKIYSGQKPRSRAALSARLIAALAVILCVFFAISPAKAAAECAAGKSACIAMERQTQTVLHEYNADARLPMASTTKIMTALIICEDCDLDRVVTVPDEAVGAEGSSIYLKRGEQIDIRDLLYGLMLRSGNDAAAALAIIHGGSIPVFAQEMNARARILGAMNTNFKNPSGLPDDEHYTTARDLCKIACAAMGNADFRQIVGTKSWHGKYRSYANKNKLLYNYEGATGIKTGYTVKAGRCLVSSALRDGMETVCVVLNEPDMYNKSYSVLDECFKNFELAENGGDKLFICGGELCRAEGFKVVIKRGVPAVFKCVPMPQDGDCAGELQIYQQNNLIFSTKLYSIGIV